MRVPTEAAPLRPAALWRFMAYMVVATILAARAPAQPLDQGNSTVPNACTAASAITQQYNLLRAQLLEREHAEDQLYQTNLRACEQPNVSSQCSAQAAARHAEAAAEFAKAMSDLDADERAAQAVAKAGNAGASAQSQTCEH